MSRPFLLFEEINLGKTATFSQKITPKVHSLFTSLSGDSSPIHTDKSFCSNTMFKTNIGYAFFLNILLSKMYGEYLPGGSSICIKQDSNFIKPYFINDEITVTSEVVEKITSTKFIHIQTKIFRNQKEHIYKGLGIVQIIATKKPPLESKVSQ